MKHSLLFIFGFLISFASMADDNTRAVTATVTYQLDSTKTVPVDFFTVLDITTYYATLVNPDGHCTSSRAIIWTNMPNSNNSYQFEIQDSVTGPCELRFKNKKEYAAYLADRLKDFPVTVQ